MNRKIFYRLSFVLLIPMVLISWWLPQQDFFLERGKSIYCYVDQNTCGDVHTWPLEKYEDKNDRRVLQYENHSSERIIYLLDFNYEISKFTFKDINGNVIKDDLSNDVNLSMFLYDGCKITTNQYYCRRTNESSYYQIVNKEDADNLIKLVKVANDKFKESEKKQWIVGGKIFFGLLIAYLILCLIIRFIIYGFKK